jgi:hypothetical protein
MPARSACLELTKQELSMNVNFVAARLISDNNLHAIIEAVRRAAKAAPGAEGYEIRCALRALRDASELMRSAAPDNPWRAERCARAACAASAAVSDLCSADRPDLAAAVADIVVDLDDQCERARAPGGASSPESIAAFRAALRESARVWRFGALEA